MRALSSLRIVGLVLVALVIAIIGGYSYYWQSTAAKLRAGLEPWAAAQRAKGYVVQWDQFDLKGFPTAFRFRFTKARFGAERPLPVTLDAPTLVISASPWNLHHWQLATSDGARLSGPLDAAGFDLGRLDASSGESGNGEIVLDIVASALDGVGLAEGTHIASASAHIALPPRPPSSHIDNALDAALQLTEVKLPTSV